MVTHHVCLPHMMFEIVVRDCKLVTKVPRQSQVFQHCKFSVEFSLMQQECHRSWNLDDCLLRIQKNIHVNTESNAIDNKIMTKFVHTHSLVS